MPPLRYHLFSLSHTSPSSDIYSSPLLTPDSSQSIILARRNIHLSSSTRASASVCGSCVHFARRWARAGLTTIYTTHLAFLASQKMGFHNFSLSTTLGDFSFFFARILANTFNVFSSSILNFLLSSSISFFELLPFTFSDANCRFCGDERLCRRLFCEDRSDVLGEYKDARPRVFGGEWDGRGMRNFRQGYRKSIYTLSTGTPARPRNLVAMRYQDEKND